MLIQFSVSNFRSFSHPAVFSMVGGREGIHPDHLIKGSHARDISLQRLAVIYGANASGKSNFTKALSFMKELVIRGRRPNEGMRRQVFRLGGDWSQQPSLFEIDIKEGGQLFHYGFKINDQTVQEEWLEERTRDRSKVLFFRKTTEDGQTEVDIQRLGKGLSKLEVDNLGFIARGTRANQLFLTETMERNQESLRPIYGWFQNRLTVISPDSSSLGLEVMVDESRDFNHYLSDLLAEADTGIEGIKAQTMELDELGLSRQVKKELEESSGRALLVFGSKGNRFRIQKTSEGIQTSKLTTVHNGVDFDIEDESDGTRWLIDLAAAFYQLTTRSESKVYVIDELGHSLHLHLIELLLSHFLKESVQSPGQLIFTTHQPQLLSLKRFRRGEIWFVEKTPEHGTEMYSLLEFKKEARYDKDILKAYLEGRYGGIPRLGLAVGD